MKKGRIVLKTAEGLTLIDIDVWHMLALLQFDGVTLATIQVFDPQRLTLTIDDEEIKRPQPPEGEDDEN